jgi:hypothetical protein
MLSVKSQENNVVNVTIAGGQRPAEFARYRRMYTDAANKFAG